MLKQVLLTTTDNPYDPFTQNDEWRAYDVRMGYYTRELVARVANTSTELSDADYSLELENAIDSILELNPLGNYRKIIRITKED